jgi:hypothetical protein
MVTVFSVYLSIPKRTVIEEPVRLCFHDSTQELGISLNFATQAEVTELFEDLCHEMTIVSPGFFFQIRAFDDLFLSIF